MSDSLTMSDESGLSPSAKASSSLCGKSTDFTDQVSDVYKNNNNNNNNEESGSHPPSVSSFSIESHLGEDKAFVSKRRESFGDECKMNVSPKESDRNLVDDDGGNMQCSPKSAVLPEPGSRLADTANDNESKFAQELDYGHRHNLASTLQKRAFFPEDSDERDRDHIQHSSSSSVEFPRPNHMNFEAFQGRGVERSKLPHGFLGGRESEQAEETSDNEMMCDDYESDSESNEPRITVREALMNRALAAAAAAAAAATGSSSASHFSAREDRRGDTFISETGGSGRTSRSGGVSPASSPGVRSSSTSGVASGRTENSSNSSLSKEPFVNGHSGLRSSASHSHPGEKYHSQGHHGLQQQSHQFSQRSSYGAHHNMPGHGSHSTGSSSKNSHQFRDPAAIKSERKSNSSSPLQSEVKPENLAALSNLSNIQSSIGNALLNLASLGSLAALQQSLPGLLSSVGGSTGGGSSSGVAATASSNSGGNASGSSPSHTSPHTGGGGSSSSPSASQMNAPLNLTHSSGGSAIPSKSHHHHHHLSGGGSSNNNNNSNNNHSRSQHSSSPFSHQSAFTHCNSMGSSGNQSSMFPGGGMIPPNLAAYFSQSLGGAGGGSGAGSSPFIPNASQLTNSLSHAAASAQSPGSLPQLVLASGQIMQGIQGAQLLIPTSQGLMTQMILTIPLTQPGSPQSMLNTPAQNTSPAIGASSGQRSSSPHSRGVRAQSRSHHGLPQCSANSPPIASTVPPSASPDYSGPGGTTSGSLMNLSSHLVNQSLGAHIPYDKMGMDRTSMNGIRSSSVKRDSAGSVISSNPNIPMSSLYPPKMSPCSGSGHESDKCSEAGDSDQMVDGINLDEIKEFAKAFKLRRLSLGLTQTQVGQALSVTEGPAYSQSAICSALAWQLAQSQSQLSQSNRTSLPQPSMFEKLDITPKSAQKIKPVLERWMKEAEDRYKNGHQNLNEFVGMEPSKKRKRRTSFTPQALEILNTQFERNTHPSGAEITTLAHQLGYEREVIRIWFCNKRQALKNTVRMMSKGSSPI